MKHHKKRWYVLLEESDFDTLSVSGPFKLGDATGIAKTLNGEAHVVNERGHRINRNFGEKG